MKFVTEFHTIIIFSDSYAPTFDEAKAHVTAFDAALPSLDLQGIQTLGQVEDITSNADIKTVMDRHLRASGKSLTVEAQHSSDYWVRDNKIIWYAQARLLDEDKPIEIPTGNPQHAGFAALSMSMRRV